MLPVESIVVKDEIDSEILLGCETATKLGILKIVRDIKEQKESEPRTKINKLISKYDCLFHGIGKHKHPRVKIQVNENNTNGISKPENSVLLPQKGKRTTVEIRRGKRYRIRFRKRTNNMVLSIGYPTKEDSR